MTDKLLSDLDRLRRQAADLRTMIAAAQAEAPASAVGADETRAVRVRLGRDGAVEAVEVRQDWRQRLRPWQFDQAVMRAFQAAARDRLAAWERRLRGIGWRAEQAGGPRTDVAGAPAKDSMPTAVRRPAEAAAPRPLDVVAEDAITALGDATGAAPATFPTAVGASAGGRLRVTLAHTGLISCSAEPDWAVQQTGTMLTSALAEALRAARAELDRMAAMPPPTGGLDQLLAESLAILGDLRAQLWPRKVSP